MYHELISVNRLIVLMLIVVELLKKLDRSGKYRCPILVAISMFYLCGLFYLVTFRGNRAGLGRVSVKFPMPFWKAILNQHYSTVTNRSVLNMLLFVPFGYLLPQWKKMRWYYVITFGFLISLLIETCQLVFHFGVFELDDLVKNTMGAVLGWLLYAGLERFHKKNE